MLLHDAIIGLGQDIDAEMRFLTNVARHLGVTMIHYLVGEGIKWEVSDKEDDFPFRICFQPTEAATYGGFLHNYVDPCILPFLRTIKDGMTLHRPSRHKDAIKSAMIETTHYVTKNPMTLPVSIPYRLPVRVSLLSQGRIMVEMAPR